MSSNYEHQGYDWERFSQYDSKSFTNLHARRVDYDARICSASKDRDVPFGLKECTSIRRLSCGSQHTSDVSVPEFSFKSKNSWDFSCEDCVSRKESLVLQ